MSSAGSGKPSVVVGSLEDLSSIRTIFRIPIVFGGERVPLLAREEIQIASGEQVTSVCFRKSVPLPAELFVLRLVAGSDR